MPCRNIKVKNGIDCILRLPGGQRIITCSWDGSFRVWDLERGPQFGEEWEDKQIGVNLKAMALSPDGKTVATGSRDGIMKLWNVDTGKVIKTWIGHTEEGEWRVDPLIEHSECGMWRVEKTIIGPIKAATSSCPWVNVWAVCYSPDGKMIATGNDKLKIWDANTGELLKTIEHYCPCLAWTLDGKTLFAGSLKIDTTTWTVLDVRQNFANAILLSPNERILAATIYFGKTVQLWSTEANKLIGTPLEHEDYVISATFSADGKFLIVSCCRHLYTWDVSAILNKAGLPLDIVGTTPRPALKTKDAPRIPLGFFDSALREANLHIRLSQSSGPHHHPTLAPCQRTLCLFSSFLRHSKPHRTTEPDTKSRSQSFSWTRDLVSGILHRRDGSDVQLQEVKVPCTAGKPRNYHARPKPAASLSRPSNTHIMQQYTATTQSVTPSSQQLPPTANASILSAVPSAAEATRTTSCPHIIIDSGWRTRVMLWIRCMPIQHTDGQH
ncbi:WD40 repeat-like protein [Suillus decipiens]|nr:WD40 repeat-like protein [Suillus decipiens]